MADLESIQKRIISFRNERDWTQFHAPTKLAEAFSIKGGELLENFLWKSRNLSPEELKSDLYRNHSHSLANAALLEFLARDSDQYISHHPAISDIATNYMERK